MTNFFCRNLQALLNKTGVTPYALAAHLNTEPSTVYRWINPDIATMPRSRTRVAIAELFGVDPNRLVSGHLNVDDVELPGDEGKGLKKRSYRGTRIPVVNPSNTLWFAGWFSEDIETADNELVPGTKEWIPAAPDMNMSQENFVAIRAVGSAMVPTIQNGDLVYVDFMFANNLSVPEFKEGDLVLAEPAGQEKDKTLAPVIRKLVYGDNEKDHWLTTTNPDFPGTRTVKCRAILGKVVAIFRKI